MLVVMFLSQNVSQYTEMPSYQPNPSIDGNVGESLINGTAQQMGSKLPASVTIVPSVQLFPQYKLALDSCNILSFIMYYLMLEIC